MWDRYKIAVINILEKEKAIRLSDLIEKVSKELNEDKKKVKNAIDYRLKNKWGREIFSLNYLRKKGHTAIKIIFLPGNESIAEELYSNLTNKMKPREISAAISHFEEIENKVLLPLRMAVPYICWNGIFTFYFLNHNIMPIIGINWKQKELKLLPKKLEKGELEEYIAKYPLFVPFHRAPIHSLDRELMRDFVENHLADGINPIETMDTKLKDISLTFFNKKKMLFNEIDKIINEKLDILPIGQKQSNWNIMWRSFFYTILREYFIGNKKWEGDKYSDLDLVGNKILYVDVDDTIYYPVKSWYFLGKCFNQKPKDIKKIHKTIIKLAEDGEIPVIVKNLFFEMEDILSEAEKVKNKLLEEIHYYFDSKHLVGICDKI